VLVLFTYLGRRDYVTAHNRHVGYTPTWTAPDPVSQEISVHFGALSSKHDDQLNLFRNYKSVEALLKGRSWVFSLITPKDAGPVGDHFDTRYQACPHQCLDKARDHAQSGPLTHETLYEGYWATFSSNCLGTFQQGAPVRARRDI
jgi:hypothetical protein